MYFRPNPDNHKFNSISNKYPSLCEKRASTATADTSNSWTESLHFKTADINDLVLAHRVSLFEILHIPLSHILDFLGFIVSSSDELPEISSQVRVTFGDTPSLKQESVKKVFFTPLADIKDYIWPINVSLHWRQWQTVSID